MASVGTYIVAGTGHSGTSLIAGTLHKLGICMGERFRKGKEPYETFEDEDFVALEGNGLFIKIGERNNKYSKWGFKWPNAWRYMWDISQTFRNPHVIFAYRRLSRFDEYNAVRYMKEYGFWGCFLEIHRWPLLVIDHNDALENSRALVEKIVCFTETNPTLTQIESAIGFNFASHAEKPCLKVS